jgi:two-component system, cell cycle sensor histidine kinase and response regulator CckA
MGIPNSSDILQAVIEATPDAIFVKDLEGRYILVNEAAARFLGRPPAAIVGRNDLELYPEATARQFMDDDRRVLETGQPQSFEGVAMSATETQAYLVTKGVFRDSTGAIQGLYGISHDITELRKAHETLDATREALFRAQKLEAVGQLTGGIAHDFNNILAVIIGNIELLRHHLPRGPYADELIDSILRAAMHGRELTGHLLAFSRQRQLNPQPVDINTLADGIVRLLGRTLGANITIEIEAASDAGVALVDPAALEAAILNVALNARDAMPNGGTVTIRTAQIDIVSPPIADDDPAPGSYVRVDIDDTGTGMPPEVAARVFEPFFTTKGSSGGTGLGLSMVYGFARQSGGAVSVQSKLGRGTCFTLYLPRTSETTDSAGLPEGPAGSSHVRRSVLIVEDEAAVRTTLARQLETLGHRAVVAASAADALGLLAGEACPDVLMTDVVLGPGMDGIDLACAARASRPALPLIFISGYAAVPGAQERIRTLGAPLLHKPATMSQIERIIEDVCGGSPHR